MGVDASALDVKYFNSRDTYNCPFCNRRNVVHRVEDLFSFDWDAAKKCHGFIVTCSYCHKKSLHLTWDPELIRSEEGLGRGVKYWVTTDDVDSKVFYSQPTSFFVIDERVPRVIRELVTEADSCLKMNLLTGASACLRKAIYELLDLQNAEGDHYQDRVKSLKGRFPTIDPTCFDALGHIQDMTSNKVHEKSWPKWDSATIRYLREVLIFILGELYIVPIARKDRLDAVKRLQEELVKGDRRDVPTSPNKKERAGEEPPAHSQ